MFSQNPEAQYFLGICYEQGLGVEVNECKAAHLYSQAAQSGHDGALYNLAVFHEYGIGGMKHSFLTCTVITGDLEFHGILVFMKVIT